MNPAFQAAGSSCLSLLLPGELSKHFGACWTTSSSRPMVAPLVMGLVMLGNHLGTLLVSALAGHLSHCGSFLPLNLSMLSNDYFFVTSPVWEPWGSGVLVSGELLAVLQGSLKIWCWDDKKKCKVNKNNSKCTYELEAGIWKLISRGVLCLVRLLIGAGGFLGGKINALTPGIFNASSWWLERLI